MELIGPGIGPLSLKCLGFFLLIHTYCYGAIHPVVRVLVNKNKSQLEVNGFDLVAYEGISQKKVLVGDEKNSFKFHCRLNGQLDITDSAKKKLPVVVSSPVRVASLGGFLRVNDKKYREDLYLYSLNGECMVVNHVDLEKYVAGLLNSEMNAGWNFETLKAQAVAARTYAIYQMKEASSLESTVQPYDLDSSVKDQVYDGAHQERYKALHAAMATKGQVLTFNGKPIKAFYHSTCGGNTVSAEKMWGMAIKYMVPVTCGYCNISPRYRWKYAANRKDIETVLKMKGIVQRELTNIQVASINQLGRVKEVIIHEGAKVIKIPATKFRELMGYQTLKSTAFRLARVGDSFQFEGMGSGHGVGLCQWGAKRMGDVGKRSEEILHKYYPLAKISKLY